MTPEQLEEIPGIEPQTVEAIQLAVNTYYAQFEDASGAAPQEMADAAPVPDAGAQTPELQSEQALDAAGEVQQAASEAVEPSALETSSSGAEAAEDGPEADGEGPVKTD
jgi:hypothetical protein